MPTNVYVAIYYLRVVSKPLNLAALFAASARTVRKINRVEDRTSVMSAGIASAKPQKDQSGVWRIAILNAQLPHQKSSHIHPIGAIMTRFVISSDSGEYLPLLRQRLKQTRHRRKLFHRRQVNITIAQTGLQSTVKQISRE